MFYDYLTFNRIAGNKANVNNSYLNSNLNCNLPLNKRTSRIEV